MNHAFTGGTLNAEGRLHLPFLRFVRMMLKLHISMLKYETHVLYARALRIRAPDPTAKEPLQLLHTDK